MERPGIITSEAKQIPQSWFERLDAYLKALTSQASKDVIPKMGLGGTSFTLRAQNSTYSAQSETPFQIIAVPKAQPTDIQQIGVNFFSAVFQSLGVSDEISISGLLSADPPESWDSGAFDLPAIGDKIWLQIGTCDPSDGDHKLQAWADTTQIQYGPVGGSLWDEYPNPVALNADDPTNPYQEFYNLLIAEVTDYETDDRPAILDFTIGTGTNAEHRQITQLYSRNVLLTTWAVNGIACLVPADPTLDFIATP